MNTYLATCKFGLEGLLADELRAMGAQQVRACNARVYFEGGWEMLCRANLWLRTADRVFLQMGSFPARTFEELFEGVRALPWEDFLEKDAAFPVKGKSARSQLHSVPDCQAIAKKAIVERLKARYHLSWFPETGRQYIVEIGLLDDVATVALDASGAGLNRRGYRTLNGDAPLAETLAAAMVLISRWKGDRPFRDPLCGSGTIPIEAALIAQNRAPGLLREFAAEQWSHIPEKLWKRERSRAQDLIRADRPLDIEGSDIDESALKLARIHSAQAGVKINFVRRDVRQFRSDEPGGVILCNPPYGERLMERKECEALYSDMGKAFFALPNWKYLILTSHPKFERCFGRRADKRRKLYNSSLVCQLYQYFYKKQ